MCLVVGYWHVGCRHLPVTSGTRHAYFGMYSNIHPSGCNDHVQFSSYQKIAHVLKKHYDNDDNNDNNNTIMIMMIIIIILIIVIFLVSMVYVRVLLILNTEETIFMILVYEI
jgi:hypothetical protein